MGDMVDITAVITAVIMGDITSDRVTTMAEVGATIGLDRY
jgi:hypothetical protein